jgi:predicted transcriptional regulator
MNLTPEQLDENAFALLMSSTRQKILEVCMKPKSLVLISRELNRTNGSAINHIRLLVESGLLEKVKKPWYVFSLTGNGKNFKEQPYQTTEFGKQMMKKYGVEKNGDGNEKTS